MLVFEDTSRPGEQIKDEEARVGELGEWVKLELIVSVKNVWALHDLCEGALSQWKK